MPIINVVLVVLLYVFKLIPSLIDYMSMTQTDGS